MKETRAEHLAVDKLRPFEGHPFKVVDNEEMDQLTWSILTQGLLTPLVVRPLPNGEYEVISDTGGYTHARRQESKRFLP